MAPNAFIGKTGKPTQEEITKALGSSAETCREFVDWLAHEQGTALEEWKSISPKYGGSLRLKLKKRTIAHLSPCDGCFRVAFILGDRAVKVARQSDLPKAGPQINPRRATLRRGSWCAPRGQEAW
jgi:Protein of unknown function (DUF3788)